ncbi:hypothetical protein ACFSTC_60635 [Nonomuraea ferruginea]
MPHRLSDLPDVAEQADRVDLVADADGRFAGDADLDEFDPAELVLDRDGDFVDGVAVLVGLDLAGVAVEDARAGCFDAGDGEFADIHGDGDGTHGW